MNPIAQFQKWLEEESALNSLKLPSACCLSTIGIDGYPNSRFVSLKGILNDSFVITGSLDSLKGTELKKCPKAALSFWYTATERQIRIQGDVTMLPDSEAEMYFEQRSRDSKIVSTAFDQGKVIQSFALLNRQFQQRKSSLDNKIIQRPSSWGGFCIQPLRIEFMEFKSSRLHERLLYQIKRGQWECSILQP